MQLLILLRVNRDPAGGKDGGGLKLNETQLALLCKAAPQALAIAARIRRDHDWTDEPADVFRPTVA